MAARPTPTPTIFENTMDFDETNDYIKSHGVSLPNGQVFLTKPIFGFKQVQTYPHTYDKKFKHIARNSFYKENCKNDLKDLWNTRQFEYGFNEEDAIVNLIIPSGALVNLARTHEQKLRASKAFCWNIVRVGDKKEVYTARSAHNRDFVYYPHLVNEPNVNKAYKANELKYLIDEFKEYSAERVVEEELLLPMYSFNTNYHECASGIHFFIESHLAEEY